ncbi:probable G-protein coupled receptor 148 [Poecilia reticulata]|nr:PREDICTED: probable G-protein coupled receptor 148 [Poecilia reticulata]
MTSSHALISNLTKDWIEIMERWQLHLFWIPPAIITFATLIVNPALLMCIFMSPALRRETRYLLVANTLIADILFLFSKLVTMIGNTVRAEIPWFVCQLFTALSVTTSSCTVITVTLMVIDTFTAVRWPLQYHNLVSPARTSGILGVVWLMCTIYPVTLMMMAMKDEIPNNKVALCLTLLSFGFFKAKNMRGIEMYFFVSAVIFTFLICYCYIRLYMVTRTQGIWNRRFSRARVTVLIHGVLLLLYFVPGLVFASEIHIFKEKNISQELVWISTVNANVFMMLPRAFTPWLYGLRYREISENLALLRHRRRESTVS